VENARGKKKEKGESNRRDDYEHKKGFGDIKKGEREEKEDIIVRRIKYGKGNLRIWDICEWGYGEEIRRVEGMEEREEGVKTIIGGNLNAKTGREGG